LNCRETHDLIHGYIDGELDLVKSVEVEEHLEHCDACARMRKQIRSLRSAVGDRALRFEPPANFEKRLQSALRHESEPGSRPLSLRWRWLATGVALTVGLIAFWIVATMVAQQAPHDVLAQEIVSSHVRSLMADHLTDVPSSDRHTVKPWFDGKLDFSPPVKDLSQQGFSLTGGRLDYIGNRPVAALVYQRGQHAINVFVWPSSEAKTNGKVSVSNGYNVIGWHDGGMAYWAVSDLNLAELQQFVELLES
jgi:anti-sigma factor RsiW